jgi:glycosyltransferase involved in cell wall biosynthesis
LNINHIKGTHILIVTDYWEHTNGVVTALKTTVKQLQYKGYKVQVISENIAGEERKWCSWANAIYIATPENKIGFKFLKHCVFNRIPFTTGFHTNWPEYIKQKYYIPTNWTFKIFRLLHWFSTAILVPTDSGKQELHDNKFKNIRVWSRGVDQAIFNPSKRNALTTVGRPILLCVSRAIKEKGLDDFCSLDTTQFGNRATKIMCGDGPYLQELKSKYPDVIFTGEQTKSQLAIWYASADVFVFPSKSDTFGNVMLESMACGTPVAAYPVTGPIDIIEPGITGCTKENLHEAIEIVLNYNRDLCEKQALKYCWEESTKQFTDSLTYR